MAATLQTKAWGFGSLDDDASTWHEYGFESAYTALRWNKYEAPNMFAPESSRARRARQARRAALAGSCARSPAAGKRSPELQSCYEAITRRLGIAELRLRQAGTTEICPSVQQIGPSATTACSNFT